MYESLALYIGGEFISGNGRHEQEIINPATLEVLGNLPHATKADLDCALDTAQDAFKTWRLSPPQERSRLLRRAAQLLRERAPEIARNMTLDEGKPLREATGEVLSSADYTDWHAEECRRIYGRIIAGQKPAIRQMVVREPVGVCAAFTPWNFPIGQAIRKVSAALGAGCTIILKGAEECPSAIVAMARALHDAGLPPGVLNIVWGIPADISEYLISSSTVRKVSFTGSVAVGKHLAAMAGAQMKRMTMELGGHAPALVLEDADIDHAAGMLAHIKHRNAGQICIAPSRFFIHESVYDRFLARYLEATRQIRIGNGLDKDVDMGPLALQRRIDAMEQFVEDARRRGAQIALGGARCDRRGYFFQPTVLTNIPPEARILHEEPFGPITPIVRFGSLDEAIIEANSLPYGLASYVFTESLANAVHTSNSLEAGMVYINQVSVTPEAPFGGVKDSGVGSEGGSETFEGYLSTKYIMQG